MKKVLGIAAVAMALGIWAGVREQQSASLMTQVQTGFAILIGCNVLFGLWLWYRAKPGSGDAMVLPAVTLVSAAMLVGILPRLFWPGAERLHIAGSMVSIIVPTVLLIWQIRRRRRLRQGERPV